MSLSPETLREIDSLVRGGFEERDRVIEILCEEMYAPGELAEADVIAAVDGPIALTACVDGSATECESQGVCPMRG